MAMIDQDKLVYLDLAKKYKWRAYSEGLMTSEIPDIKKLLNLLITFNYNNCDEYKKLKEILDDLYIVNRINTFNSVKNVDEFVNKNSIISSLVFANNESVKIKYKNNFESLFRCQFKPDKTQSMVISPSSNKFFCYACNCSGNSIDYIMKKEDLASSNALDLLAAIFKLNYPNKDTKVDKNLVRKYQYSLISDEYYNFLLELENRYYSHQEKYSAIEQMMIETSIEKTFAIVERVKRREWLDYKEEPSNNLRLTYKLPSCENE